MSSWLDQFQAHLDATKASRQGHLAPTAQKSSTDIAYDILRMRIPNSTPFNYKDLAAQSDHSVKGNALSALKSTGHDFMSGGQTLLDYVTRPMHAISSVLDYNVSSVGAHNADHLSTGDVLKGDASAFWRGLSGQEHTQYDKVMEHGGVENKYVRAIGGFVGDVLLDPTTYIGVGAVRGAAAGVAKLAGKELPKLGRAKNAFGTATVLTESEKAAADLAESGSAKVHDSNVSRILEAANKPQAKALPYRVVEPKAIEGRIVEPDPSRALGSSASDFAVDSSGSAVRGPVFREFNPPQGAPGFAVDGAGTATYKPWQGNTNRLAAEAHLTALQKQKADLLTGIESKRYAKGTTIDPIHRTNIKETPEKYFDTVTEDVPSVPTDAFIKTQIRAIVPEGQHVGLYGRSGHRALIDPKTGKNVPKMQIKGSNAGQMHLGQLDAIIKDGGKIPSHLKGVYIPVGGKLAPLPAVVKDIMDKVADHELFGSGETITKQVERTRVTKTAVTEKLNPSELAGWVAKHKEILHPEDMRYILQGGSSAKNVATRIERVLARTEKKNFKEIADLKAALEGKQITEKGLASLRLKSGVKASAKLGEDGNIEGFKSGSVARQLNSLEKKIEKARQAVVEAQKNPTPAKVKAAKAAVNDAEKSATKAHAKAEAEAPAPTKAETDAKTERIKPGDPKIHGDIWTSPTIVQNAEKLVDEAAKGNTTAFAKQKISLHPQQAAIVEDALKNFHAEEFVKPKDWKFKSNRGTLRDSNTPGVGRGRNIKGVNKFSQLTLGKKIMSGAAKLNRGLSPEARPAAMYDTAMPMYLAAEQRIIQEGAPLILGRDATGFPMSVHDILSSLDRGFAEKYFFTPETSLHITQLADIAEQFVRKGLGQFDAATVRTNLTELVKKPGTPLDKFVQDLGIGDGRAFVHGFVNDIYKAFDNAEPKLMKALSVNSAAQSIKVGDQTKALSNAVIERLNNVFTDPHFSAGEVMDAALNTPKLVAEEAAKHDIPVSAVAEGLAGQEAAAHAAASVPLPTIATAAKGAEGYAKATTNAARAKVSEKLAESADSEGRHLMEEMEINTLDLGVRAEFASGMGFFRAFAPHLGNEALRPILTERMSVAQTLAKQFTSQLSNVYKRHTTADLKEALKALQEGKEITTPAMEDMHMVIKELFNVGDSKYGLISRNGITAEHLTEKFKKFGVGDQKYQLSKLNIDNSWKTWDIEDPLDFMSKFHAAVASTVAEKQLGAEVSRMFGEVKPKPGWVQIRDSAGKSPLAALIDTTKFYPPDIARQMHMLDKTLLELAEPNSANKLLRTLDSALHAYKAGVTIYRPGHHVRNLVGDMWLASMDGVRPGAYKRAAAVLGTRKSQYQDFDALRALQEAYKTEGAAPKSVLSVNYKGQKVNLSPEQVYRMAFDSGVLPDYSVLEDISFGATQQADHIAATIKKVSPFKGNVHKAASSASEYRDHYVRIAHFIHAMESGGPLKGATLDEALKNASHFAGNRVRKWHPDGSDLSKFEKNVMRRSVLFYSWVRKAVPLVIESAVTRPGKFMAYPKAMQSIAAMHGINLEGYGDPFPTDQLFPSYIADSTQGPQGGEAGSYAGIKPGIPSMDVMDDFMTSPLQTLRTTMGSMNPLGKIPVEVATGNQLRTGTPIMDKTDYIDAQIPGANYIDKLAGGRSLSSGFTQSNRKAPSNEGYSNPNLPGGGGGLTDFINWLTGIGLTDYSRPSNIKSAQREMGGQ